MSSSGSGSAGIGGAASDAGVASLEDCYTNIFHITELTGLKWCCLVSASDQRQQQQSRPISAADNAGGATSSAVPPSRDACTDGADDAVLRAYTQCVADGVLCAWRRRQPPCATAAYESPVPRANATKELWLFWYSADEPKHIEQLKAEGLAVLIHTETVDMDSPRVEFEYETRTLFFKALNTAIERRLLAEGFVRFGHWLCRPLEPRGAAPLSRDDRRALPRFVNAVRFNFFLHRESLVCASLCVQRQPTILRLSRAQLQERTRAQPVILAPWSIRARLVPGQQDLLRLASSSPVSTDEQGPATSSKTEEVSTADFSSLKQAEQQRVMVKRESVDIASDQLRPNSSSSVCGQTDLRESSVVKGCDDGGDDVRANIASLFDRQWTEWKRLYQNLAEPPPQMTVFTASDAQSSSAPSPQINSTTSRSTTNSSSSTAHSGRNSSGGNAGGCDGDSSAKQQQQTYQQALPRLVLVEVNGHRMLYPSQFVAVLFDELLPTQPKKPSTITGTNKGEEATEANSNCMPAADANGPIASVDNSQRNGDAKSPSTSLERCSLFPQRMRRRAAAAIGKCAARRSFEDAFLRPRGVATTARQQQQQTAQPLTAERTLDEFNYDYARREFCYCRICYGGSVKNGVTSSAATTPLATANIALYSPSSSGAGAPLAPATQLAIAPAVASLPSQRIAPPAPFHHRQNVASVDGIYIESSQHLHQQQQVRAVEQQQHKIPSSLRKKATLLGGGKGSSSKSNTSTKFAGDDAAQSQSVPGQQPNRWAHGCSSAAVSSSASAAWEWVPDWDLLKSPSSFANRRKTQQQLIAGSKTESLPKLAASGTSAHGTLHHATTAVPIDPSASALAELLMDEDDGMVTDGADGCDPIVHRPIQDLLMLGHPLGHHQMPSHMIMPSDTMSLLAQQRQRAATFGIVQQQLHHQQQRHQQQQLQQLLDAERRQKRQRMAVRGRGFLPDETNQITELFTVNPFDAFPPLPLTGNEKAVVDRQQQYFQATERHQSSSNSILQHQQQPVVHHQSILERLLLSPAGAVVAKSFILIIRNHRRHLLHTVIIISNNNKRKCSVDHQIPQQTDDMLPDAESMPNAETPPALLDTSEASASTDQHISAAAEEPWSTNCSDISTATIRNNGKDDEEMIEADEDQERNNNNEREEDDERMMSMSSIDTSPASATSPATGPSSVGGQSGAISGSGSLAAHRMVPVAAALLMRGGAGIGPTGDDHQLQVVQLNPHHILSPPASNERIDSSVGSAYSQQQQHGAQSGACWTKQRAKKLRNINGKQQLTKTTNLLDTMEQLAERLRRLPDESPLYDGVKARPIAMFGLFAGDLLNEQLAPEERIRQCCGASTCGGNNGGPLEQNELPESKAKLMRQLHEQLNQRRKRLSELCQEPSSSLTSLPLLPVPPAYTKRAKLAMAARLAADKADGDAGLDARLQEVERLRYRGGGGSTDNDFQQGATGQFGQPPQQWAPGANNLQFSQLPSAIPPSMLQQRSILSSMPHNFSPSQLFPSGNVRLPQSVALATMGQPPRLAPSAALVNPMRSPSSFPPTSLATLALTSPASSAMYQQQQQHLLVRQQQMMTGASTLSRSPSVTALQQQSLLQRRSSVLVITSPNISTAPTSVGAVTMSEAQAKSTTSTSALQTSTAAAVMWDGLLQAGKVGVSCSARLVLLIQDTMADLHYDIVFDSCPLCCCNSNIRSAELGIYIGAPRELLLRCDQLQRRQRQLVMGGGGGTAAAVLLPKQWSGFRIVPTAELQKCNCGFSAVRHRYLCGQGSGLFADDIAEAGGLLWLPILQQQQKQLNNRSRQLFGRFNPANPADRQFVDLLMHLCISQDVAVIVRNGGLALDAAAESSISKKASSDYTQSPVDVYELNDVMDGILELIVTSSGEKMSKNQMERDSILHPWGYQAADGVGEPRDVECLGLFEELKESFMRTAPPLAVASLTSCSAAAPMIPSYSNGRRLEQLTLRAFARKSGSTVAPGNKDANGGAAAIDVDNGRVEPIPQVLVLSHAEREPMLVSAQVLRDWDRLELMPADQCKDVLYLTVIPDVNVIASKCKVYMEELSNMYERRCRLGIHVPIGIRDAPRDGILRVGREQNSSIGGGSSAAAMPSFPHAVHAMFMHLGPEFGDDMQPNVQRLRTYVEGCYVDLCRFFLLNDHLFERRAFHESAYRQQQQPPQGTSLASVPDAVAMPPPAVPSGSIGGGGSMSVQSGPASATGSMHHHHHTGGPGSSSGSILHSPMAQHQQQTSPATGNTGPNSVPILHGGDGSSTAGQTVSPASSTSMAAALQRQTAEEMAQLEEKLVADLNVITGELENTAYLPHVIVCYLVNPFGTFGSDAAHRHFGVFASAVLLRMWNEFLHIMPPKRRPQLQLELLSLRSIYDYFAFVGGGPDVFNDVTDDDELCASTRRERSSAQDELKRMVFTVYTQTRILRPQIALDAMTKSMTRFGSMERIKDIIQMFGDSALFFKFNCNPYLLAPARSFPVSLLNNASGHTNAYSSIASNNNKVPLLLCPEGERVLFLAYCILPGDDWLCAAVTDERGALLDNTLINLCPSTTTTGQTPGVGIEWRHRQRHSQIADALQRLWMFAQSVMLMQEVRNWRLVIGRMGKLGHGEFKQWTEILSKKNLKSRNNALKGKAPPEESGAVSAPCHGCAQSHGWAETPALLSACLVSTEPEPHLRVMASTSPGVPSESVGGVGIACVAGSGGSGGMKPGGGGGSSNCVGMLSSASGHQAASNKPTMGTAAAGRQSALGISVGAQQQWWSQTAAACPDDRSITHIMVFQTILNVSMGHHQGEDLLQSGFDDDGDLTNVLGGFNFVEQNQDELDLDNLEIDKDEEAQINNQPMAIGYTVSTAPLPPGMPSSFWQQCPAARRRAGASGVAHLKSSLHINTSNLNEEYGGGAAQQRERDSGGAGSAGGGTSSAGGGTKASVEQQLQHPQHPLDAAATDDVLRFVLETYNALSWLSLDPVTGARRSCLPVHMQAIQRLHLAVNTFWGDADQQPQRPTL
uniref:Mediator of RNA polymerase II transcription subunit 13 n=1 Tax=Globodera pallida TaxID=36090 RepID=A0A183C4A1_GLOPA